MNSLLALAESGSLGRTCPLGNAFAPPFGCTARPSSSSVGIITAALLGLTFVGSLSAPITTPVALTGRKMFSDEEEGINETSAAFDSSISADRRRSAGSSVGDRNIACSPSTLKNEMLPAVCNDGCRTKPQSTMWLLESTVWTSSHGHEQALDTHGCCWQMEQLWVGWWRENTVGRDTVESLNTGPVHEPVRLDCPRGVVPRIEEALLCVHRRIRREQSTASMPSMHTCNRTHPAELEGLVAAL